VSMLRTGFRHVNLLPTLAELGWAP
jgi:hypothetical protein